MINKINNVIISKIKDFVNLEIIASINTMNKIEKQKDILLTLAHCKKKIRTAILQKADRQLVEQLVSVFIIY